MPGLDRTGPEGKGPKTGRGKGLCSDSLKDKKKRQEDTLDQLGLGRGGKPRGLGRRRRRARKEDSDD